MYKVLIVGDATVAGLDAAWKRPAGYAFDVRVESLPGYTTEQALDREFGVDFLLEADDYDVCLLAFGARDVTRGASIQQVIGGLLDLQSRATRRGVQHVAFFEIPGQDVLNGRLASVARGAVVALNLWGDDMRRWTSSAAQSTYFSGGPPKLNRAAVALVAANVQSYLTELLC